MVTGPGEREDSFLYSPGVVTLASTQMKAITSSTTFGSHTQQVWVLQRGSMELREGEPGSGFNPGLGPYLCYRYCIKFFTYLTSLTTQNNILRCAWWLTEVQELTKSYTVNKIH